MLSITVTLYATEIINRICKTAYVKDTLFSILFLIKSAENFKYSEPLISSTSSLHYYTHVYEISGIRYRISL